MVKIIYRDGLVIEAYEDHWLVKGRQKDNTLARCDSEDEAERVAELLNNAAVSIETFYPAKTA